MEPILHPRERVLILLPDRNSPPKKDFTYGFLPEAESLMGAYGALCEMHQIAVPVVDSRTLTIGGAAKQRGFEQAAAQVIRSIRSRRDWTRIIFLCHGWQTGLQLGFRNAKQRGKDAENLEALIEALRTVKDLRTLTLFACSAGDEPGSLLTSPGTGDNSIGDLIRDRVGCTVIAHWTAGHTTRNPDIILFEGAKTPMLGGVSWPERGTKAYRNAARLLTNKRPKGKKVASGDVPPLGGTRPAFTSIPLCQTVHDLQALFSSEPAF